jgi:hypothetical protein
MWWALCCRGPVWSGFQANSVDTKPDLRFGSALWLNVGLNVRERVQEVQSAFGPRSDVEPPKKIFVQGGIAVCAT